MWKYIVTWCIVVMTIEPVVPVPDEFGRTPAIFGYETGEIRTRFNDDCGYERWFDDRKEAFAFYGRAINDRSRGLNLAGHLRNINIDSIWSYPDTLKRQDVIIFDPEWLKDTIRMRGPILPSKGEIADSIAYTSKRFSLDSIKIEW